MRKDSDDMRPEYDFSGAKRSKYAARLSDSQRQQLLHRSAALDAQYWLGHTLQRIQQLEATLVAYLTLALERSPDVASEEAAGLLDGQKVSILRRLISKMKPSGLDWEDRFRKVMDERSWLIHKGGFALASEQNEPDTTARAVQRLAATAREATALGDRLRSNLEAHLGEAGITAEEVRKRTDEVIHRWLAA
jgi:hypothetical protein